MRRLNWGKATLFSVIAIILLLAAVNQVAFAHVSASISGRIEDSSGAAVPGATVTVTNVETGAARTVVANEMGTYTALSLPVGKYEVKAEKAGFAAVVRKGHRVGGGAGCGREPKARHSGRAARGYGDSGSPAHQHHERRSS